MIPDDYWWLLMITCLLQQITDHQYFSVYILVFWKVPNVAQQTSSTQTSRLLSWFGPISGSTCGPGSVFVRCSILCESVTVRTTRGAAPPPLLLQELSRKHFDGESEAIPREDKVFFVWKQREARKPSHSVTTKTRNKSSRARGEAGGIIRHPEQLLREPSSLK